MPLSVDNIIQLNTGSFEGTSGSATLPSGTTAGSAVLIFAGLSSDNSSSHSISTPSGFDVVATLSAPRFTFPYVFLDQSSAGSETSWTLTVNGGSRIVCWAVAEVTGLDMTEAFLAGVPNGVFLNTSVNPSGVQSLVTSRSTNTSSTSESFDSMALAFFVATSADSTIPVISGHTNGFTEIAATSFAGASQAQAISLAAKPSLSLATYSTTVSVSPSAYTVAALHAYTAADARHAPNIETCAGFEVGTATGLATTGIATGDGPPIFDAVTGSPSVVTTSPRTGSYCLELSSSSAAECVTWTAPSSPTPAGNLNKIFGGNGTPLGVCRFHVYFPTSLPSADTEIASVEAGSLANGVVIRYVSASQKLGVKIGSGTEVLSDATVAASKWIGIDFRYDPRTTTHTCDWQVDYDTSDATAPVAQTSASTGSMTAAAITTARFGWSDARTATVRYDDIVWTRARKAYPIGGVNIRPLKVDPAGTPTISGTSTNFQVFTNNGSGSAWNATNARNALDDVPPSIGSTADGVMQINVATSDYAEVPMETYTAAPDHVLRAARWYWAGWAGSGNPASCRFDILDGTTDRVLHSLADHGFDDTALVWMAGMHRPAGSAFYQLNQDKVDGLKFRWGWSDDANPDAGIHCALVELVTQPAVVYGVLEAEGGAFNVYVRQDPVSAAVASYLVTTPSGSRGATFTATINGSDFSQYVNPNTTYEKVVGAVDIAEVTAVGLIPDPTA